MSCRKSAANVLPRRGAAPRCESRRGHAFQRPDASGAQRLFNVTMLAPAELRWSPINGGQKELIDHVLASAGLMPVAGKLRRVPMIDIRNFDSPTAPRTPRVEGTAPDHAPVTALFAVWRQQYRRRHRR
jgi:hypothetical protein